MAALKQLTSLRLAQRGSFRAFASAEAAASKKFYDVPEGHIDSDLSQTACNIGLNRRRDLTLGAAAEIKLNVGGTPQRLADLLKVILPFWEALSRASCAAYASYQPTRHLTLLLSPPPQQGHKTVLFGVPDCGKVCSEQHVPGYLKEWEALRKLGVSQILCVAVDEPAAAAAWGESVGADGTKVAVAADTNAALTRMLGVELGDPAGPGPRSLRYSAVLDDGILLKLVGAKKGRFLSLLGVGWNFLVGWNVAQRAGLKIAAYCRANSCHHPSPLHSES